MAYEAPFQPIFGKTVSASVTDSSGSTAVALSLPTSISGNLILNVANIGDKGCYLDVGSSSVVASTADYYLLPYSRELISVDLGATYIAAICASGETTTLKVIPGYGS